MKVVVIVPAKVMPICTWSMHGDMSAPDNVLVVLRSGKRTVRMQEHVRSDSGVLETKHTQTGAF